ncbi:alpha-ketoacid dehydrogenase subunit beta [Pseudofrankia asymbiotica]|uniref:Alpha-ketoacid dehydrogenase subunit beta n=1 Tax=Pseudofrankia asymbiotica TaxID=1834516 RepID=A0A1V2IHC1_9ACTN|nr:transketolase C-terminal domain-containing protein [Pseudofrankia asymbiotica]ONH32592.1 alpha-ketoacid dehydrogenase subunit beta [Pseudofrankia asymbiotica]
MRTISYREAVRQAMLEEMRRDPNVVVFCEDARFWTMPTHGFVDEFGPDRVPVMPISEEGFTGAAIGAAMTGVRPIVDYTIANLMYVAWDQIVNHAAKNRYLFGGQASVPIVFRAAMKYANATAAQHSDRPYPQLMNVPGLKIVVPSNPADALGLLKSAIRDDDPVVYFEPLLLWGAKGEVPDGEHLVPIGQAAITRPGRDVTVVAIGDAVPTALKAAGALAKDGTEVEVIDPRTLVPLDKTTILESVARTGRLVIADPAHKTCGAAAEISAIVAEEGFGSLRAPIVRVVTPDVHPPFSPALERLMYPTPQRIADAVRTVLGAPSAVKDLVS